MAPRWSAILDTTYVFRVFSCSSHISSMRLRLGRARAPGPGPRARAGPRRGPRSQRQAGAPAARMTTTKHVCDGIHYLKRLPPAPVNPDAYPMILFLHVRRCDCSLAGSFGIVWLVCTQTQRADAEWC